MRIKSWVTCALLGLPAAAVAQTSEVAQEGVPPLDPSTALELPTHDLFFTQTAQVQPPGTFQFDTGMRLRNGIDGTNFEVPIGAEVGITPGVQLTAQVPLVRDAGGVYEGVDAIEVGGDYRLAESPGRGSALSVGLGVEAPVAGQEVPLSEWAVKPRLRAFQQVGIFGLNGEVAPGLSVDRDGGIGGQAELAGAVTFGTGAIVPVAEGRFELAAERSAEAAAGLRFRPNDDLEIGTAVIGGLHEGQRVIGGTAQLVVELGGP